MTRVTDPGQRNWKQEPLVWMLIAIPLSAVIMGVVMITLAIQSYSGLVVDDYYKKGKQINRVLARDRFAHELGLAAGFKLNDSGEFEIRFDPSIEFIPGDSIEFKLVHATMPGLDQSFQLTRVETHLLRGEIELPGSGRWNLVLQTGDWRLTGSLQHPLRSSAELLPNYSAD
jgi:hypothetical protein